MDFKSTGSENNKFRPEKIIYCSKDEILDYLMRTKNFRNDPLYEKFGQKLKTSLSSKIARLLKAAAGAADKRKYMMMVLYFAVVCCFLKIAFNVPAVSESLKIDSSNHQEIILRHNNLL